MLRILILLCALALSAEVRIPTDIDRLNRFANEYNRYAEELREGVVDMKQWARVVKAWRNMAGE